MRKRIYKPKPPGATKRDGYTGEHRRRQVADLAAWRPGDPCTRCGLPMWQRWRITATGRKVSAIHLDHDDYDRTKYRGLAHASCNIAASNRSPRRQRSRARQRSTPAVPAAPALRTSRQW